MGRPWPSEPYTKAGRTHTEKAEQTQKDRQGGGAVLPQPILKIQTALQAKSEPSIFPTVIIQHPSPWSCRPWAQRYCALLRGLYLGGVVRLRLTTACLELSWQLRPSERLLLVTAVLVPGRIRLRAKNGILFIDCQGWKGPRNSLSSHSFQSPLPRKPFQNEILFRVP